MLSKLVHLNAVCMRKSYINSVNQLGTMLVLFQFDNLKAFCDIYQVSNSCFSLCWGSWGNSLEEFRSIFRKNYRRIRLSTSQNSHSNSIENVESFNNSLKIINLKNFVIY